jgi:hypothetical protein
MYHKIYSSRKGYRLPKGCDKTTETIKDNPKFPYAILCISGTTESFFEDIRFMFFAREYSYYFEVCKCIDDSIEEIIPVSVGNFLIFVCGIAKFLYPPNRKRKEESERLLQS